MAPKVAGSRRSQWDQLRRLAIVFKVQIRLKIVAELYRREMSPTEFYEEFGGGSPARIAQNFAVLERHGWLRRVGQKHRTRPSGRPETLYRATELVLFDADLWRLLPYSVRLAYSWSVLQATAKELRNGIEGACLRGRLIREITAVPITLDETGWQQMIKRLALHFDLILEEQTDAKIRAARTGNRLFRVGLLQSGFELPTHHDRLAINLAEGPDPLTPLPERLAPIFEDRLSMEILAQLNRSEMSVKQFHRTYATGGVSSERIIRYRFDRLKDLAWVSVVDTVPRRGAKEYIYRATRPSVSSDGFRVEIPDAVSKTDMWAMFERFTTFVEDAIVAGTFDMRDDRHLSWTIVDLDRIGWQNVIEGMDVLGAFGREEEARARKRVRVGAKPLTMVLGLAGIESPNGFGKAP